MNMKHESSLPCEQLYVFGTGNAAVTHCYNTCFAIRTETQPGQTEFFMVDAGGGNGILGILDQMQVPLTQIHHIFVTHEHTDHILGIVWMVRMIGTQMKKGTYEGTLSIYCHDGLVETIKTLCRLTLQKKFCDLIGTQILLIPVADGETRDILGYPVTFFDIHSTKARQFGFTTCLLYTSTCLKTEATAFSSAAPFRHFPIPVLSLTVSLSSCSSRPPVHAFRRLFVYTFLII